MVMAVVMAVVMVVVMGATHLVDHLDLDMVVVMVDTALPPQKDAGEMMADGTVRDPLPALPIPLITKTFEKQTKKRDGMRDTLEIEETLTQEEEEVHQVTEEEKGLAPIRIALRLSLLLIMMMTT